MTATFSTQIHRALFALPLLAIGCVAVFGTAPATSVAGTRAAPGASATLPRLPSDTLALVAQLDCDSALRPAGALGLARMPGDIGVLDRRLRCAR